MTEKIFIGVSIIIFWLAFGFLMGFVMPSLSNDYETSVQETLSNENSELTVTNVFETIKLTITLFFKGLFVNIPNIPPIFKIFVYCSQIISLVVVCFCFLDLITGTIGQIFKFFG